MEAGVVNSAEVARGSLSEGGLCGQESRSGRAPGAVWREGAHPHLPGLRSLCRLAATGTGANRASEVIQCRKKEVCTHPLISSTHLFIHSFIQHLFIVIDHRHWGTEK